MTDPIIEQLKERVRELCELLEESQALFAHGVGAMTDNGDRDNQERNVREGGELMLKISKALLSQQTGDA